MNKHQDLIISAIANAWNEFDRLKDSTDIDIIMQESLEMDLDGIASPEYINGLMMRLKNLVMFVEQQ